MFMLWLAHVPDPETNPFEKAMDWTTLSIGQRPALLTTHLQHNNTEGMSIHE